MSSVVISGDTSGTVTVAAPAVAGSNTLTLLAATATNSVNTLSTAVASTSGTSIDFTSIPSWVKRITVMFSGVSTSGTSNIQIQIGAGSVTTTGYASVGTRFGAATGTSSAFTTGIGLNIAAATDVLGGSIQLYNITGNTWVAQGVVSSSGSPYTITTSGYIALGGSLDRVRVTTVNGTDTFDAGTVNILYEG